MKKVLLGSIAMLMSGLMFGQTTIRKQSFETTGNDWGFTANPVAFTVSTDIWDTVTTLGSISTLPSDGSNFWGVRDLENSNGGTAGYASLNFDSIHVTGLTNVYVRFDWNIEGFDGGDTVKYEVFEDGTSMGLTTILGGTGSTGNGTIDHAVTAGADSVRLVIYVKQNGGSDYAGFDNVRVDTGALVVTPVVYPYYPIATINTEDANGVADSLNVMCWTSGVVVGVDLDGNTGYSFTIMDTLGGIDGINIYKTSDVGTYTTPTEGDSLMILGSVAQFNGLTRLSPDSIILINQNNPIPDTVTVTSLDETTESELVKIEDLLITAVSGSNYTLVSGLDTFVMRVDSDTDVDDSLSFTIGDSLCYVIGIGGQFDSSNPYTDGYQIFPRYYTDVDTSCGTAVLPPPPATPFYPIADINDVDANGVADSNGVYCWTKGVVLGVNMNGFGLSFTIWDNEGIGVYNNTGTISNYTVTEGDSIMIRGTVGQFNGLTQLGGVDSIMLVNAGNTIPTPTVVTDATEATESELVRINDVLITAVSGSNYTLVNAIDTLVMRIDSDTDVDDSLSFVVGDSLCYVIGIGGQYDNSNPYTDGYQIFPRYYTDVDTSCGTAVLPPPPATPFYPIADINDVDANGEPDSIGVYCWTKGVVLGIDLDGNAGISFTIFDEEGINVYNSSDVSNYVVTEGDSIMVRGEIDFFNGLTEISPDSIMVLNQGNTLPMTKTVTSLNEETESAPIRVVNVTVIDPTEWGTGSSSFNVRLLTCNGDTIVMRADSDTDVGDSISTAPTGMFTVTGIGGQYDNSAPYFDEYQIFPMSSSDIDTTTDYSTPMLYVNEIMADNDGVLADDMGEFDDWVELYNPTSEDIMLGGLFLTDDATEPMQYMIPTTSTEMVAAGGYAIIWTDSDDEQGDLHTNFSLSASGEYIGVTSYDGCAMVDGFDFPALDTDVSYGRVTDGNDTLITFPLGQSTPNAMNMIDTTNSIGEIDFANNQLVVYPNPSVGNTVVKFNQTISFEVYDVLGNLVTVGNRTNELSVATLNAGVYLVKADNGEVVRMVIK